MEIVEIDAPTGVITKRAATAEEIATQEADVKYYADLRIAEENITKAKELALISAKEKLEALGLSVDEIKALIG